MDTLSSWFMSMVEPLVARAVVVLGMGVATYTGVDVSIDAALSAAQGYFGQMPMQVAQLVARFGFFDFMAITSGGLVSGMVWMSLKRWVVTGTGSQ